MTFIFPIEAHPNTIPQLVVALESIKNNFDKEHRIIVVNHNNSVLPDIFVRFIEKYDNVTLLNIELTNNKFYYKTECFFLLMPEVFNFVVNEYPDLDGYVFLDPDVYCVSSLPKINNEDVYVFKTPESVEESMLTYCFTKFLDESYKEHYDTFFIYTKNQDFARLWLEESINIAKKGIAHKNIVINYRLQNFCEEIAIYLLEKKFRFIVDARELNYTNAYINKDITFVDYSFYHYDYYSVLERMDIPKKYKILFNLYGTDIAIEKSIHIPIESVSKVKKEIDDLIEHEIVPVLDETICITGTARNYNYTE